LVAISTRSVEIQIPPVRAMNSRRPHRPRPPSKTELRPSGSSAQVNLARGRPSGSSKPAPRSRREMTRHQHRRSRRRPSRLCSPIGSTRVSCLALGRCVRRERLALPA
jgi:hypothetical protein